MVKNNKRKTRPSPKQNLDARSVLYDVARQAHAVALGGNLAARREFYKQGCCAPLLQALLDADNLYTLTATTPEDAKMKADKLMSLSGVYFCLLYYMYRAGLLRDAFPSWPANIRRYVLLFKTQLKCTAFYIKSLGANVARRFDEKCYIILMKEEYLNPFSSEDIQHRHDLSASMLELACSVDLDNPNNPYNLPHICSGAGMLVDIARRRI